MKSKYHILFYKFGILLFRLFIPRKFNFIYDEIKEYPSPYIVVSNHATNWDPILIGLHFKKHMYYVASEQVFRMGFKSTLLKHFVSPIPIAKSAQEIQTVINIFRRLKDKCNVCIFAEGKTTSNGETTEIQPSIGKLVKRSGVALITYRFTGSYLTFPKWARFVRKGKMEGNLVQIYSPEKLTSMSEAEIYEAIKKDLYVNAYAEQEKKQIVYRGKKPAEYLETILYCCPKCKEFSTLKSCNDLFSCNCGYCVRYNEYGYFESLNGEPAIFKTILEWSKWQKKQIEEIAGSEKIDNNIPVITDDDQILYEVSKDGKYKLLAKGKLNLYKDRLIIIAEDKQMEFALESINYFTTFARMRIIFSTNDNILYEIHSKKIRSSLKYMDFHNAVKAKSKNI